MLHGGSFYTDQHQHVLVIDGLQPIPRDSVNKDMAAMLVEQTEEVLEKSFVISTSMAAMT